MNRIPFQTWPVEHKAVSSVLWYAMPRFHRLFHPSRLALNEHDDAFRSDPAGWLPMNTMTMLFLRSDPATYTSPGRTYICASRRSRPRPYVHIHGRIFFLARWPLYVLVHATCAPLLRNVRTSTTTHVRLYYDTCAPLHPPVCTYMFATRMTTLCTLRPGGSRLLSTSLCAKI